jgi:hypothetical protein
MLDGNDVNLEQVKSGSAWVYEKYIDQVDENTQTSYRAAQTAAQQERRGLWSDAGAAVGMQTRCSPTESEIIAQVSRPRAIATIRPNENNRDKNNNDKEKGRDYTLTCQQKNWKRAALAVAMKVPKERLGIGEYVDSSMLLRDLTTEQL